MFKDACEFYGTCIGSKYCFDMTVEYLVNKYELTNDEANEIAVDAFAEWSEAYE